MMKLTLQLNPAQAALLSHAIVEFQDSMHRQSHEDDSIDESFISDLQNIADQILDQTNVTVFQDVFPSILASDEEIAEYNANHPNDSDNIII